MSHQSIKQIRSTLRYAAIGATLLMTSACTIVEPPPMGGPIPGPPVAYQTAPAQYQAAPQQYQQAAPVQTAPTVVYAAPQTYYYPEYPPYYGPPVSLSLGFGRGGWGHGGYYGGRGRW
jgi:hypothetical protein